MSSEWRSVNEPEFEDGETVLVCDPTWIEPGLGYRAMSGGRLQWFGALSHGGRLPSQPTLWMPAPTVPDA
jgi:hypothetical protein